MTRSNCQCLRYDRSTRDTIMKRITPTMVSAICFVSIDVSPIPPSGSIIVEYRVISPIIQSNTIGRIILILNENVFRDPKDFKFIWTIIQKFQLFIFFS